MRKVHITFDLLDESDTEVDDTELADAIIDCLTGYLPDWDLFPDKIQVTLPKEPDDLCGAQSEGGST